MNSTKLFNINYLKENLKKSKGFLLLICALVPLFTTLVLTLMVNSANNKIIVPQIEIIIINILGMFCIPTLLSYILFGYVFKKNSVDLVNSMPLKRSTIFVTNTIGGIIIITLIQAVTAILILVCSIVCENLLIFPAMIWDMFLVMWITYLFIFIASNLAMTVSGTFLTQCAVTLLIIFLVPFCTLCIKYTYTKNNVIVFTENGKEIAQQRNDNVIEPLTMPSSIIYNGIAEEEFYNTQSMTRTVILSIVYYIIGYKLFKRRKMENAEESFETNKVHLFVKALTMLPMILFIYMLGGVGGIKTILYALVIVYYFFYDFIVKKKIPLKYSIPSLVLILVVLNGMCGLTELVYSNTNLGKKKVDIENIKGIAFDYGFDYHRDVATDYINDKELINSIFEVEKKVYNTEGTTKTYLMVIRLKDKYNKEYKFYMNMNKEDFDKITSIVEKTYINKLKELYYNDNSIIKAFGYTIDDSDLTNEIYMEIKTEIEKMNMNQLLDLKNNWGRKYTLSNYKNHKIRETYVPIDITNNSLQLIANYQNKRTINGLKEIEKLDKNKQEGNSEYWYYYNIYVDDLIDFTDPNREDYLIRNYYFNYDQEKIIEFIKENENTDFDATKEYYVIEGSYSSYGKFYDLTFFTNDIQTINNFINEDMERHDKEVDTYEYDKYIDYMPVDGSEIRLVEEELND